jgi:DNA-binding response OmpR family regulator
MNAQPRILIAEDDPDLGQGLLTVLGAEGYAAALVARGDAVEAALAAQPAQALILDVMLPGRDGYAVLRALRAAGHALPILLLTAKSQEADKVQGFDLGADDYLTKPFGIAELLARLRGLLRRVPAPVAERIMLDGLMLDFAARRLHGPAGIAELSSQEAELLRALAAAGGAVRSRQRLLREAWPGAAVTARAVDFHIANLRKKLAEATGRPGTERLATVHGRGWRFC